MKFANINKFFPRLPIRRKLLIGFLGMGFLPLLIGGAVGVWFTMKIFGGHVRDLLSLKAELTAGDIEDYMLRMKNLTLYLSRSDALVLFSEQPSSRNRIVIEKEFSELLKVDSSIFQIRYIDTEGWERARVNASEGQPEVVAPSKLQLKSDRYYFVEGLRTEPGEVYISPLDFNIEWGRVEEPRRTVIRFATVVETERGRKAGLVVINVFGDYILGFVDRLTLRREPTVKAVLVDDHGTQLSHEHEPGKPGCTIGTKTFLIQPDGAGGAVPPSERPVDGFGIQVRQPVHIPAASESSDWYVLLSYARPWTTSLALSLLGALGGVFLALTPIITVIAWMGARQLTTPLLHLREQATRLAQGRFDARVKVESNDEIEDLAEEFNRTAERLEHLYLELEKTNSTLHAEVERRTREVLQAEKMASAGIIAAGIVHEVSNPLAAMKTIAQAILSTPKSEEARTRSLERLLLEIRKMETFVRTFRSFASPSADSPGWCNLAETFGETLRLFGPEAERRNVRVASTIEHDPCAVQVGPRTMQQMLMHLLVNALDAMPDGGEIQLSADRRNGKVDLSIRDTGLGMSDEQLKKIFDPFFTTKPGGTGLGLSIVYRTVAEHGGEIGVESRPGSGTCFTLRLPART